MPETLFVTGQNCFCMHLRGHFTSGLFLEQTEEANGPEIHYAKSQVGEGGLNTKNVCWHFHISFKQGKLCISVHPSERGYILHNVHSCDDIRPDYTP